VSTHAIVIDVNTPPGATGEALRRLLERSRQAAVTALRAAAVDLQRQAVLEVDASSPYPPVDTGVLKRSFTNRPTPDGAIVENVSPQAVFMEFGTRPHWAPLPPLLAWAGRKARGGNVKSVYALAKGAQKKIAREGTTPRKFWERALLKVPVFVDQRVREALARARGSS